MSRLGLAVPPTLPPHADVVLIAQDARRRGLESFWLAEGLGKDALVQLGALATQVDGITLGTAIVNTYSRSATVLAMAAATLYDVSGGRFVLGLGSSLRHVIETSHDISFDKPLQRTRDYITIIRQFLMGQRVTHIGAAHSVRDVQLTVTTPQRRLPIYVAVVGLGMARMAGEVADGVILHMASLGHVGRVKQAIKEGATAAGRDASEIDVACFITSNASHDETQARRVIVDIVAHYGMIPHYQTHMHNMGFHEETKGFQETQRNDTAGATRCVSERLLQELSVAAGPEEIRHKVEAFRQAGVDLPIVYSIAGHHETTTNSALETLEAIATI